MVAFVLPLTYETKQLATNEACLKEKKLVKGIRDGDKNAMEDLYKLYSSSLFGIITRIIKFDEVAEDVLQDTFFKIWKSISYYDPSKGKLFTWMANLAKNTAIDQLRSKNYLNYSKTDNICNASIDINCKHYEHFNIDVIGMQQLIQNLNPDQQKILDMIYFEGYTHVEVSDELNIPLGTVKTKIRLSILKLRKYFNEDHINKLSAV